MKTEKNEKIQDLIIDKYYGEIERDVSGLDCKNAFIEKKLKLLKNKLEVIDNLPPVKVDIQKIIENAIETKAKKQEKVNFILFLFFSFLVFSIYVLVINIRGFEFFIKLQFLVGTLIPWFLIPVSLIFSKGKV
uniref:Uncharacterized protein n=1 Tax=Caldicellulosiruptor owensensis TaxID=55205 RepID=A0A7C5Z4T1_9FIRM